MIETQWRVTWFPPEQDHVTKDGSEERVRRVAAEQAEWNPIIEFRTVEIGEWWISAREDESS